MSYHFSKESKEKLATCDVRLQKIMSIVIELMDCTIICGHRDKEAQDRAFAIGASTKQYPDSKHNADRSLAVDVAPYPIDWNSINDFYKLAGMIIGIGKCLGIDIRWGGNFKKLNDYGHFEIRG